MTRKLPSLAPILLIWVIAGTSALAEAATSANEPAGNPANAPRFDGAYAAALDAEKDAAGRSRWIVVRLYEDGTSVEAEFHGELADCASWLSRDNERLYVGRWKLLGSELTVLESRGTTESERTGTLGADAWTTTPTVKVKDSSGWALDPVARAGGAPLVLEFTRARFPESRAQPVSNRRPFFEGVGRLDRYFDYDRAGNLKGIDDRIQIQVDDLDHDPVTFRWYASNGAVTGEGPGAAWKRVLLAGKPVPGTITVEISDGRGGRTSHTWDGATPPSGGWTLIP